MFLVAFTIGLTGCSSNQDKKITVDITVKEEFDSDNRLKIYGSTNLPDDMELMLSITGEDEYSDQSKVHVYNGLFESDWISNQGRGLKSGNYNLLLTSSAATLQPNDVQKLLGQQGENLVGEYIVPVELIGNVVGFTYAFHTVTSSNTLEEEDVWEKVNGHLATGQYKLATELIEQLPDPSNDLQMMQYFIKYQIQKNLGEDKEAIESLDKIPSGYTGRNEDLVSYYKYLEHFYEDEAPFSFNDYVGLYRKNRITSTSFSYYKQQFLDENKDPSSNSESIPTLIKEGDINVYGEYQPVETMTAEELLAELEEIVKHSLPSK